MLHFVPFSNTISPVYRKSTHYKKVLFDFVYTMFIMKTVSGKENNGRVKMVGRIVLITRGTYQGYLARVEEQDERGLKLYTESCMLIWWYSVESVKIVDVKIVE